MPVINDTDSADERAAGYEEIASEMLGLAECAVTRVAHEQFTMLAALYGKLARQTRAVADRPVDEQPSRAGPANEQALTAAPLAQLSDPPAS